MSKELNEYTYFIDDVKKYFEDLILLYDFKVYLDTKTDGAVFVENDKCKIWLCIWVMFPHQNVSYKIFKKINNQIVEIDANVKLEKLNLTQQAFDEKFAYLYRLEVYEYITIDQNEEFKAYQESLIINKKIIEKFYIPLIYNSEI